MPSAWEIFPGSPLWHKLNAQIHKYCSEFPFKLSLFSPELVTHGRRNFKDYLCSEIPTAVVVTKLIRTQRKVLTSRVEECCLLIHYSTSMKFSITVRINYGRMRPIKRSRTRWDPDGIILHYRMDTALVSKSLFNSCDEKQNTRMKYLPACKVVQNSTTSSRKITNIGKRKHQYRVHTRKMEVPYRDGQQKQHQIHRMNRKPSCTCILTSDWERAKQQSLLIAYTHKYGILWNVQAFHCCWRSYGMHNQGDLNIKTSRLKALHPHTHIHTHTRLSWNLQYSGKNCLKISREINSILCLIEPKTCW